MTTKTLAFVFALMVTMLHFGLRVEAAEKTPNILLLCIDDLRPELACFGKEYIQSPNIDRLAARGRAFHRHYVQAPTCGASRYTLLTGRYGNSGNGALFERANRLSKSFNGQSMLPRERHRCQPTPCEQ